MMEEQRKEEQQRLEEQRKEEIRGVEKRRTTEMGETTGANDAIASRNNGEAWREKVARAS